MRIGNKNHYIHENLICGHYYPEGSLYYEDNKLLYQNCEKIGEPTYASRGYRLINVVLGIGSIATVARVLQGYKIEHTGNYFNTFINDNGLKQAIVYPFHEMDWEKFKNINEARREANIFERDVKKELIEKCFTQNENGFWIYKNTIN